MMDFSITPVKETRNISYGEEVFVSFGSEYPFLGLGLLVKAQKSLITHKDTFLQFYTS